MIDEESWENERRLLESKDGEWSERNEMEREGGEDELKEIGEEMKRRVELKYSE